MIEAYERHQKLSESNKVRIADLMKRKSANGWRVTARGHHGKIVREGWDPAKKAKMVRRYMAADSGINESLTTIAQLKEELGRSEVVEMKHGHAF